jgi:hypothetical protein
VLTRARQGACAASGDGQKQFFPSKRRLDLKDGVIFRMKVCLEVQVTKDRFYDRLHELVAKRRPSAIAAIAAAQRRTSKVFKGSMD